MPKVRESLPYQLYNEDCFQTFARIPSASVDMVLCDLPYGTTACKWDAVIPFAPLWEEYRRICKPNAAIVLTANLPFTASLVASNLDWFRYAWVWEKSKPVGHLRANLQPMRAHEDILVFGRETPPYFPQGVKAIAPTMVERKNTGGNYGKQAGMPSVQESTNFPRTILKFGVEEGLHPTQKPVKLMQYLIKTYTEKGATVLDNCMGSGTTGVAAMHLGRKFIGCDSDTENGYFDTAELRIKTAYRQAQQKRPSIEPGRV